MAFRFAASLLVLAACASEPPSQTPPPPCVEPQTLEFGLLRPELEAADGTLRGVDLDGRDSDARDEASCRQEDWPDPDGTSVDAASADLVSFLSAAYGVDEWSFFLGSRLEVSIDPVGREEGVCAGVAVQLPGGPRQVAQWNGNTFRAYGLGTVPLLVQLPGVEEVVLLRDAALRLEVDDGRVTSVILAGALSVEELVPVGRAAEPTYREESIRTGMQNFADLRPGDGFCTEFSVAIEALP